MNRIFFKKTEKISKKNLSVKNNEFGHEYRIVGQEPIDVVGVEWLGSVEERSDRAFLGECAFIASLEGERSLVVERTFLNGTFEGDFCCYTYFLYSNKTCKELGAGRTAAAALRGEGRKVLIETGRGDRTWGEWVRQGIYLQTEEVLDKFDKWGVSAKLIAEWLNGGWRCDEGFRDREWDIKTIKEKLEIYGPTREVYNLIYKEWGYIQEKTRRMIGLFVTKDQFRETERVLGAMGQFIK